MLVKKIMCVYEARGLYVRLRDCSITLFRIGKFNKTFSPDVISALYVGHMDQLKGASRLVEYWMHLSSSHTLSLFGTYSHQFTKENYQNLLAPNITLHGFTPEIISQYLVHDIYVSCSLSEGCPHTIIEALCSGCICLLSDIPPHLELMEIFPDYIVCFKDNHKYFTRAFDLSLELLTKTLRINRSRHALDFFSSDIQYAKIKYILAGNE